MVQPTHDPAHATISSHRVEGTAVYNLAGERIGRIEDILIEKVSGQATCAILCYAGALHAGGARFPIPWDCLHYDTHRKGYVVDEDQLKAAPQIDHDRYGGDLPWREGVFAHWAAPPYWFGAGPRPGTKTRR